MPGRNRCAGETAEFAKRPRAFANSETDVTRWHAVACVVDEREFARLCTRAGVAAIAFRWVIFWQRVIAAVIDRIGLSMTKSGAGSSAPFAAPPRSRKCLTAIDNCQAEQPAARRLPATKKSQ